MKKLKLIALGILALAMLNASAASRITLTITVTNAPVEGDSLTLNADTRTFVDSVTTPGTEIATGADIGESTTNLYFQIASTPFSGPTVLQWIETNQVRVIGAIGQAMTASLATNWGTLTLSTQTVATLSGVRVPMASVGVLERTNNATLLVTAIDDYAQSPVDNTATAWSSLVGMDNAQAITGAKTLLSVTTSNLVNVGVAASSPGSGTNSEEWGQSSTATGTRSLAVGYSANASYVDTVAIGYQAAATNTSAVAIGVLSKAYGIATFAAGGEVAGNYATGIGNGVNVDGAYGIAIGAAAAANYDGSIAIGTAVATTAAGQIRIGVSTNATIIPGTLQTTVTNSTLYGTIGLLNGGVWNGGSLTNAVSTNGTLKGTTVITGGLGLTRTDYTSLASGNNAGVDFGSATLVKIDAGPGAAFTINGIAGGFDGRVLILDNRVAFNMTIAHDSGVDPTAANRIYTNTGSDASTTTEGVATLVYDSEDSRWHLINLLQ